MENKTTEELLKDLTKEIAQIRKSLDIMSYEISQIYNLLSYRS